MDRLAFLCLFRLALALVEARTGGVHLVLGAGARSAEQRLEPHLLAAPLADNLAQLLVRRPGVGELGRQGINQVCSGRVDGERGG